MPRERYTVGVMVKVKISFQGQTVDFDLNRDSPFQTVIDAACTQLNAPGAKTDYSLQLDSTGQHISPQVRFSGLCSLRLAVTVYIFAFQLP